jgi:hypothetical protein
MDVLGTTRGLACFAQDEAGDDLRIPGRYSSHWVAMAEREADLGAIAAKPRWHDRGCGRTTSPNLVAALGPD